jgi:N-acetylglucosamine-6-phosphate deacetylase
MTVDPQVNGYLNVDFSQTHESEDRIRLALREYLKRGADIILPTLITSSLEAYAQTLPRLSSIISEKEFEGRIPGIHLEGPFISREPGAVGAHNPHWVQNPQIDVFKRLQELSRGKILLLTMAAECPGAAELCKYLVEQKILVSLGHQMAGMDDLSRLADQGATLLTHLGNGMPNQVHRHDNSLINGLLHPTLIPMLIGDGHHLTLSLVEGIIALKGVEKVVMTSDASPLAGMPPGEYVTLNNRAVLTETGKLYNPDKDCLVGSSYTLKKCRELFLPLYSNRELDKLFGSNFAELMANFK